ncbi:MAG: RluA family pseudouridine synthase [Acidimicrobiales bacterium]
MALAVPAALDGERVDRGLALLAGLSRAEASRLVAAGGARLAGVPVRAGSRRLRVGELLELQLDLPGPPTGTEAPGSLAGTGGPDRPPAAAVVYADDHLVVVDKPAGLVVHPGAGNREGTLVQQLLARFPDISGAGPDDQRPGIVHRLDKGTSGLLVVARTAPARQGLVAQLAARSVERRYLAVVHGVLEADEGVVEAPLGRSPRSRLKMAVVEGGRQARTHYRAGARSASPLPVTLVTCRLETGRTHQVRAHFAAIGHPVLADQRYAKASQFAAAREILPTLRRPWLHAAHLGFVHPATGEAMSFSSALPADLQETLGPLGLPQRPSASL